MWLLRLPFQQKLFFDINDISSHLLLILRNLVQTQGLSTIPYIHHAVFVPNCSPIQCILSTCNWEPFVLGMVRRRTLAWWALANKRGWVTIIKPSVILSGWEISLRAASCHEPLIGRALAASQTWIEHCSPNNHSCKQGKGRTLRHTWKPSQFLGWNKEVVRHAFCSIPTVWHAFSNC